MLKFGYLMDIHTYIHNIWNAKRMVENNLHIFTFIIFIYNLFLCFIILFVHNEMTRMYGKDYEFNHTFILI